MRPSWKGLSRYRPRLLTLAVFAVVAAVLVLANLSDEVGLRHAQTSPAATLAELRDQLRFDAREPPRGEWPGSGMWNVSYGWPLLWRQYVAMDAGYGTAILGETHSAGRLAGNVAMWLVMLAAPVATCEWLLRRYRPKLRWSLRTMLVAIGLVAACCGWFVAARNRANVQDPLIDEIERRNGQVWVERWGPDWLDVVGADRLRRRIIGADPPQSFGDEEAEVVLKRLAQLPKLQYLSASLDEWTPDVAGAFKEMRRLRTLSLDISDPAPGLGDALVDILADKPELRALSIVFYSFTDDSDPEAISKEFLTSISRLTQLESLRVQDAAIASDGLACLASLANLKSLTLDDMVLSELDHSRSGCLLSSLPALPRLESLDLDGSDVGDRDLRFLVDLPRLKSLDLANTDVTGRGLTALASLKSLEELVTDCEMVSDVGREPLRALERLRALHIVNLRNGSFPGKTFGRAQLPYMPEYETVGCLKTLNSLRKSKPELVIDGDSDSLSWPGSGLRPSESEAATRSPVMGPRWALRQWKQEQAKQATSGSK